MGKKIQLRSEYEPWVLARFSGYLCIDEAYDGSYCIIYAVDPKYRKRVAFKIIEGEPSKEQVLEFLQYLKDLGLKVLGITTDGSPLYPEPIRQVFPSAKHQVCIFHIIKEINELVLKAVARYRRQLPPPAKRKRGRPSKDEKAPEDKYKRLREGLWEHRYLFVKKRLRKKEAKILKSLCRGHPVLADLRLLVDLAYKLFDRRCKIETARKKLEKIRKSKRFRKISKLDPIIKKLCSRNLEKALEFLDDPMLEATSNAVEGVNRRHRKMQKTIYRVRTKLTIENRIKLDMIDAKRKIERSIENSIISRAA